jgi:3D (Asp-Asp-Asp) domain-containing protein
MISRHLLPIVVIALAAALLLQHGRLTDLVQKTDELERQVAEIKGEIADKSAALSLLSSFVSDNREKISSFRAKRTLTVTAYSAERAQTDDTPNHTATNNRVRPGIIAVSRDLFDQGWVFGKKVYIKGLGIYTIDDLMAAHKSEQIDVFMPSTRRAIQFGKKELNVYLLDEA